MQNKLPRGVYALVDDSIRPDLSVDEKARAVLAGGIRVVQLRLKLTADRPALAAIRAVVARARPLGAVVLVNDRVDLALVGGADGAHLGSDDLPPDEARRILGPRALIGVTTRTVAEIERAKALGADHVGLGPVFATRTKVVAEAPLGIAAFAELVRQSPLPVVGIAGITLETVGAVSGAGAWCAAVASDLFSGGDVVSRAAALQRAFWAAC